MKVVSVLRVDADGAGLCDGSSRRAGLCDGSSCRAGLCVGSLCRAGLYVCFSKKRSSMVEAWFKRQAYAFIQDSRIIPV